MDHQNSKPAKVTHKCTGDICSDVILLSFFFVLLETVVFSGGVFVLLLVWCDGVYLGDSLFFFFPQLWCVGWWVCGPFSGPVAVSCKMHVSVLGVVYCEAGSALCGFHFVKVMIP